MAGNRSGTHSRSQRALLAGLTVVTAIGAVACGSDSGTKASTGGTKATTGTTSAATTGGTRSEAMPSLILAGTSDRRVVLLSAQDGSTTRVLATNVGSSTSARVTRVAANSDTAFYSYFVPITYSKAREFSCFDESEFLESIGIDGQHDHRIGPGRSPAISPDGRRLAYVRGQGNMDCSLQSVVVRDLQTGKEHTWRVSHPEGVGPLSWASDSRHLLVNSAPDNESGGPDTYRVLDTETGGSLSDAPKVPLAGQAPNVPYVLGELGELGDTGTMAGFSSQSGDRVVALDPKTGNELRTLYTFPVATLGGPAVPKFEYEDHGRFESDASGRYLLWVVNGVGAEGVDKPLLFRFSVGEPAPVELGNGIVGAAWVPGSKP